MNLKEVYLYKKFCGGSGGGYSIDDIARTDVISGDITLDNMVIRPYAFARLENIGKVTLKKGILATPFPNSYCFALSSVTEVNGDFAQKGHTQYYGYIFHECKSLRKVVTPDWQPYAAFNGCSALESIDVYNVGYDNTYANCTSLKTIILRSETVQALGNNNSYWAFCLNNTPFDPDNANATGGFVLVPAALVSEYQIATNWSIIYEAGLCTFLPLEEYTVDGTTTGEINWDKLNAVVYAE